MPKPDVELRETYAVADADVSISVIIGEGQTGASSVFLDSTQLVRASNHIGDLRVGPGRQVTGKSLLVQSIVNDVSVLSDRMSVTYVLKGGQQNQTFIARGEVTQPGGLLFFEATFDLTG
jgi:hypothetical protein